MSRNRARVAPVKRMPVEIESRRTTKRERLFGFLILTQQTAHNPSLPGLLLHLNTSQQRVRLAVFYQLNEIQPVLLADDSIDAHLKSKMADLKGALFLLVINVKKKVFG